MFSLDGKVAIITGSSRGIGFATAMAMAQAGAQVVISSRKPDACLAASEAINARVGRPAAAPHAANIASKDALQGLVEFARDRFGAIDIVVCNAASNPWYGPMSGLPDEAFRKVLENNILANHWLVGFAADELAARGGGAVIVMSSVGGLIGTAELGAYAISKAADMQLVRNLAVEHGALGIRVNAIAPGVIRTDFARALYEDRAAEEKLRRATPLGRIGEPEDVAGCAVFLASAAARHITGQTVIVDGGMMIKGGF